MRTIDADALIAEMHNVILEDGEDRRTFYEVIERQPTIEPQRMMGKWETIEGWDGDEVYRCSECGEEYVLIDGTPKENGYHFCPNCGSYNGGEQDVNC